ncbi:tyrosine protein phosphatase [Phyllobacterium salinisoli]|uniref:Tyrosine protein phosphatase n=1 Tax=Phyllobacterium salinisoli TaxID=1899321 RepID=A0A368K5D6_9HYPH|nr:dual specificity protein phosphatase family protein [Phyllobacterium salinisoli]RCS23210.1 tyrosine protein phosphatase [Phyllobacterium salinisoli]
MPHIVVSPLSRLCEAARVHRPRDMVTLINTGTLIERPDCIEAERHLFLGFNDIVQEMPDMTPPAIAHVEKLVSFAKAWDRQAPLLIHCFAGISRSTAAAYIVASALNPDMDAVKLAASLRERAPSATPNIRLIRLADDLLGRGGRMVDAVNAIGRGAEAFEGVPFVLPLEV